MEYVDQGRGEGRGQGSRTMLCDPWELLTVNSTSATGGLSMGFTLFTPIHVGQRSNCATKFGKLEIFCWMTSATLTQGLTAPIAFRLLLKLGST